MLVIEPTPNLECTIGEPFLTLEQVQHLSQKFVKRHSRPTSSTWAYGTTRRSSPL